MRFLIILLLLTYSGISLASDAKILNVKAEVTSSQKFNITVTVEHDDQGWEHYANAWRVYSPDGELIDERVLHHPHVKEQPFTRTLRAVNIPSTLSEVTCARLICYNALMKRVYSEPSPIFIYQIKDLLEEKGIHAIIKNEHLSGGVGELPPTEVWPELWVVNKEDKTPAKRLVDEFMSSVKSSSTSWKCPKCSEDIEGQFNICWHCGQENTHN